MAEICAHAGEIVDVTPSSPDTCLSCLAVGDSWAHLRICLSCGYVGCCDNSKNQHARQHFHEAGHPIIQSFEVGEIWRYCFIDDVLLPTGRPLRRRVQ